MDRKVIGGTTRHNRFAERIQERAELPPELRAILDALKS
jgi:hypothetical protein